jgi:hypothetical protein
MPGSSLPDDQPVEQPLPTETSSAPAMSQPRRRRWQWSLATLLLLTAAVAAWTAWYRATDEGERLKREIASMEALTRKLVVDDPSQYAVVKLMENWNDENRWRIHLPPGETYRLNLATEQIDEKGFPEPDRQIDLPMGGHQIELITTGKKGKNWRVEILVNDKLATNVDKAADWQSGQGWGETGGFSRSEQLPITSPLVLKRRRFMRPQPNGNWQTTPDPAPGILLWIESSQFKQPAAK